MKNKPILRWRANCLLCRVGCCLLLPVFFISNANASQITSVEPVRSVLVEVYFRSDDSERAAANTAAVAAIEKLKVARGGMTVVLRDTEQDPQNQERLTAILRHYKVPPKTSPVIYGCNRIIHDVTASNSWESQLQTMLRVEVFVRTGCPHCAAAKRWLPQFMHGYPGLELVYRDIAVDSASAARLSRIVEQHKTMAASVPVFYLADKLHVGFESERTTGERLRALLQPWTHKPSQVKEDPQRTQQEPPAEKQSTSRLIRDFDRIRSSSNRHDSEDGHFAAGLGWQALQVPAHRVCTAAVELRGSSAAGLIIRSICSVFYACPDVVAVLPVGMVVSQGLGEDVSEKQPSALDEELSLPLPSEDMAEIADDALPIPGQEVSKIAATEASDHIEVPVFGRLSATKLGMPLFTLAIGLVDGFNPCAMWVLLFLLSILVNLGDRRRILAIAGTFVIVSGFAYFAFMAAWLKVFMLVGYVRPIQIALALMAIAIGSVHTKDFFAFKKGISLSIPESAKPGIYAKVRKIVTAEHMAGAVAGAITLAILVNVIELLCTAGLPALYTNILMQQGLSPVGRYAYLALYILAYMFDDTLMVAIVVITLSKRKLQETQGRWLKLISGAAILLLGIVMLFQPEWLY